MAMYNSTTKEEQALKNFLLDTHCLDELECIDTFNFFDILKVSKMEIRHSNVISWLLDPNENHGLNDDIIRMINAHVAKYFCIDDVNKSFKLLTMNYDDALVYREWQNIDILVELKEAKHILCIENKIGSQEHSNQLNRYYEIVENKYGNEYTKTFLYLTPEGIRPINDNNNVWNPIKYETLISIIERALNKKHLEPRRREFIQSYIDILKRETMDNTEIIKICQEIYRKHKDALDLIFEHRPDELQNLFEIFKEWSREKDCNGDIIFVENKSSKSYCRFRTHALDEIIPAYDTISGWYTNNYYFYEIKQEEKNGAINYWIQLVFSSQNLNEERRAHLENIDAIFNNKKPKENWQWRTVFKTKTYTIRDESSTLDRDAIFNKLNTGLNDLLLLQQKILSNFKNN